MGQILEGGSAGKPRNGAWITQEEVRALEGIPLADRQIKKGLYTTCLAFLHPLRGTIAGLLGKLPRLNRGRRSNRLR